MTAVMRAFIHNISVGAGGKHKIPGGVWAGGEVGMPQNIMRALCAVILLDHFRFASNNAQEYSSGRKDVSCGRLVLNASCT